IHSSLGAWIDQAKPEFGPAIAANFALTRGLDRRRVAAAVGRRERYYRRLREALGPRDLVLLPTAPALAPGKGALLARLSAGDNHYPRALALTSIAGIGRLPQCSVPLGDAGGVPVGLSVVGALGADAFLLAVVQEM